MTIRIKNADCEKKVSPLSKCVKTTNEHTPLIKILNESLIVEHISLVVLIILIMKTKIKCRDVNMISGVTDSKRVKLRNIKILVITWHRILKHIGIVCNNSMGAGLSVFNRAMLIPIDNVDHTILPIFFST